MNSADIELMRKLDDQIMAHEIKSLHEYLELSNHRRNEAEHLWLVAIEDLKRQIKAEGKVI